MRREVEIKFRLRGQHEQVAVHEKLVSEGFILEQSQVELDYSADTEGYKCREHGILVRFRRVTSDGGQRILLTFKKKLTSSKYLDAEETEMYLDKPDAQAWQYINQALYRAVGLKLPDEIVGEPDFIRLVELAFEHGFSYFRILVEKKRSVYRRGRVVATIDELPGTIGRFLELEAHSDEELGKIVDELGLKRGDGEKLDYGDIIIRHNGARDMVGRTAVFDESVKKAIYELVAGQRQ